MTETVKIDLYADNLRATQAIATQLAQLVSAGTIILLEGNLGSGKTTFMQAFGLALGIQTTITSPTFTLIDEYTEGRLPLYHIDLYRLEPSQVPSLHLEEYWRGQDFPLGVVAIEWASKLINLPPHYLQINLATPTQASLTPNSDQVIDSDWEFDDDLILSLPEERTMQIIAKGEPAIAIIQKLRINPETDRHSP